ncbi:hypothetical protein MVEN_01845800 [Mycena venus]|uniref:F-box domain-containing protein n=1 Tax=Mycena venus TaxID=2733690 RepID=A0A8H6XGL6_9AGAR|nr:hypothetical protein MVEN_01845800 [Mycena venus]
MISLPQELIEAIVGLVDDLDALKACSLVCMSLVPVAQRILLRSLTIQQVGSGRWRSGQGPRGVLSIQRAHAFLQASPNISSYIRHLKIRFTGPPLSIGEEGPLESILSALTSIEDLVICGSISAPHSPITSLLPGFLAVLQLPTIERVCLLNIRAISSSFLSLAMASARIVLMQNISVAPVLADEQDFVGHKGHLPTARLEHLIFQGSLTHGMSSVLDLIVDSDAPQYLHRVHTLEVAMPPGGQAPARRIIAAAATTVEHLLIDYGDCYRSRSNNGLQLPLLPALRYIELILFLGWVRRLPQDLYSTVAAFPDVIPNVRRICLVFVLDSLEQQVPWQDSGMFALFDHRCGWRSQLPRLRRLECCLELSLSESNPETVQDAAFAEFVASTEARFPGLRGTGILSFSRRVMLEEEG